MIKYLNSDDPNCRVCNGKDFIYHFITSNFKTDTKLNEVTQEYVFFNNKNESIDIVKNFLEVLNDLSQHKIIKVNKYPDKKHIIKFILKEAQQEERDFVELHEIFDKYITANFDIIYQRKFDQFVKQNYIHDEEFILQKAQKRKNLYTIIGLIFGLISIALTLYFGLKALM